MGSGHWKRRRLALAGCLAVGSTLGAIGLVMAPPAAGAGALHVGASALASAPTDLQGQFQDGGAELSWTAPTDDGGDTISDYVVTTNGGGQALHIDCPGNETTCDVGLTNGITYSISVAAANLAGVGPSSNTITGEPEGPPFPPTGTVAIGGNRSLTVSWLAPTDDGGQPITGYVASAGSLSHECSSTTTTCTITGLTNGKRYVVTVSAQNQLGDGDPSSPIIGDPSATPKGPPSAVRHLRARPHNRAVGLSWKAPSRRGTGIADYEVCVETATPSCVTQLARSYTFRGLTNGTAYTFTVQVVALDGETSTVASVTATPSG